MTRRLASESNEQADRAMERSGAAHDEDKTHRHDDLGLMTIEAVAAALGVAPGTVKNWVSRREIPFVPIGGPKKFRIMFNRDSVRAWLLNKEYKPRGYR
jgi:excisionase family DNA binding protein